MPESLGYSLIFIAFFIAWSTGCQAVDQVVEKPVVAVSSKVVKKRVRKAQNPPKRIIATVIDVHDGDTLTIEHEGEKIRIRLYGSDAPEYDERRKSFQQPWGKEAMEHLRKLCKIGDRVEFEKKNKSYDRLVANVYKGEVWVNAEMIKSGLSWVDTRYSKSAELLGCLADAKKARRRIWSQSDPESPWAFRDRMKRA